jgi:hypothetical protein
VGWVIIVIIMIVITIAVVVIINIMIIINNNNNNNVIIIIIIIIIITIICASDLADVAGDGAEGLDPLDADGLGVIVVLHALDALLRLRAQHTA